MHPYQRGCKLSGEQDGACELNPMLWIESADSGIGVMMGSAMTKDGNKRKL
jgi:hypothetical protein